MAKSKYEFIKIEMRLFNDPKFFMLSELDRLTYIMLIALAKQTRNLIKKDWRAIGCYLRDNGGYRSPIGVKSAVNRIMGKFDNIRQDKYNLWFDGWEERYSYGGVDKEKEKEKDKEKDISSKKKPYYKEYEMRKAQGRWWVLKDGEWLEFNDKESAIIWK